MLARVISGCDPTRSCCRKVFAMLTNARGSAASPVHCQECGLTLLPHGRCGAYARWRVAEAPAERAIEMRNITKADPKRDIDDRQMQMVRVSQHRESTIKPAFCKVLGE